MGSSVSGQYSGTRGSTEPKNGVTYNRAGSGSVRKVELIVTGETHSMPTKFKPNSVFQRIINGVIRQERYYNSKGDPYLDIDYTDHSRPDIHTNPHQHLIKVENGKFKREERSIVR